MHIIRICVISYAAFAPAFAHHSKRQNFYPTLQHVDVSGAHAFIPPGPSDLRGPCPALNAMANHGYIARNGYTTLLESANAVVDVYGGGRSISSSSDLEENH